MEAEDTIIDKNILRSNKVRQIGPIPSSLVRLGIFIIAMVSIALIAAICLLPYPYSNEETILFHIIKLTFKIN